VSILLSIVIPTHNRREVLARCLDAIEQQAGGLDDAEVIVVDDGSTDGTAVAIQGRAFSCPLAVVTTANGGPGRARNAGAERATGTYLVFTEDDVVPDPDWLESIRQRIAEDAVDVLEGRTVSSSDRRDIRRFEREPRPSFIPCNLVIRRELFVRAGGYDADFFDPKSGLYFREDADLGFRLLAAGRTVTLAGEMIVEHPPQFPRLGSALRHARRYMFDPLLYRKHPVLYRDAIEVKSIAGITIRRPMHYLSLAWCVLALAACMLALRGSLIQAAACGMGVLLCTLLVGFKYQGPRAWYPLRLPATLGFAAVPPVYLLSLLRGCFRFRSFGLLV
jgi:glycosyltransferase involved in cell wall biosynthesis